jgi:hypothetical protein
VLSLAGCARAPHTPDVASRPPGTPVDSATIALWRLDETGGTRAADAGPGRLDAAAGVDTRTIFGRFRGARLFALSTNSFLYVPYSPRLDSPGALTVETWVAPNAFSQYECATLAARWSLRTTDQSWLFAIVGIQSPPSLTGQSSPGWLQPFVQGERRGRLLFVFQPEEAGAPRAFVSLKPVELQRWTHVAVTFDGEVVSFWIDGRNEGTFATRGRIRASQAPLLAGGFFDTRFLTDFGGDLRQGPASDTTPWYALDGGLDELRLSTVARKEFPLSGGR